VTCIVIYIPSFLVVDIEENKYYFQFRLMFFSAFRHGIADSSEVKPEKSQKSWM
jgi:hypothetical protein